MMALGASVLLCCVRDFYVSGKGTRAPWSPPKQPVVVGLYRYCRNPMYIGVLTLVAGRALVLGSAFVAGYAAALPPAFHLRASSAAIMTAIRLSAVGFESPTQYAVARR